MKILGYILDNEEKIERAIQGVNGREGKLYEGVGEDASDEVKLAAYDRLGGLILKGGRKVKTGCFCDLKATKEASRKAGYTVVVPFEKPKVILLIRDLEGNEVEIDAEKELTPEQKAAEKIENKKKEERNEAVEKKTSKK